MLWRHHGPPQQAVGRSSRALAVHLGRDRGKSDGSGPQSTARLPDCHTPTLHCVILSSATRAEVQDASAPSLVCRCTATGRRSLLRSWSCLWNWVRSGQLGSELTTLPSGSSLDCSSTAVRSGAIAYIHVVIEQHRPFPQLAHISASITIRPGLCYAPRSSVTSGPMPKGCRPVRARLSCSRPPTLSARCGPERCTIRLGHDCASHQQPHLHASKNHTALFKELYSNRQGIPLEA